MTTQLRARVAEDILRLEALLRTRFEEDTPRSGRKHIASRLRERVPTEWLRRPSPSAIVTFSVVSAAFLFVFSQLQPSLLLANTTPSGGDMGAQVWGPAFMRDYLLPKGRLSGWTPDWYAGFPAYTFYFPVPALLIVALDVLVPYGIAFKLVSVSGLLSLPVAAYAFGRLTGMRFPGPALLAVFTIPFLFFTGYS
ncbi:MAG: hypothetical protein M3198_13675, partial [Actinomycetota bacterium]|nr:hypothetical protein [Actinomycetota bacterium]